MWAATRRRRGRQAAPQRRAGPHARCRTGTVPSDDPTPFEVRTPFAFLAVTTLDETVTVHLVIAVEPQTGHDRELVDRSFDLDPGDDTRVGDFTRRGRYHFVVEMAGADARSP